MGSNALVKSAVTGVVLQGLMVMLGKAVPSLAAIPNFYAIAGTVLSVLTGALYSKWAPGAVSAGAAASGGALAGGGSSVLGGLLAVMTGQWPGFQLLQILFPAISGGIGGGLGGVLGRVLRPATAR